MSIPADRCNSLTWSIALCLWPIALRFGAQIYLGPREWSPLARWTFREFNEVMLASCRFAANG